MHAAEIPGPTLSCDIRMLLQSGSYSGVQVQVQGEVIPAHLQILRARSQVFKRQVVSGMKESISKTIVIEDCDVATFKCFLRFYTDNFPNLDKLIPPEASGHAELQKDDHPQRLSLQALLAVSHKYQVSRLQLWREVPILRAGPGGRRFRGYSASASHRC